MFSPERQAPVSRHMGDMSIELPSWDRSWLGLMHALRALGACVDVRDARGRLRRHAAAARMDPHALQEHP